ncbi:EAL domain-containing protein [Methylobacterium sp. BTF04]|uniref:sensor domain-containing phosphodiesterase n=1 Tax=Methylobacterium sp. BTF04 TaxID=2708300 RepID=UPI0013D3EF34|nr:EAL domain-containing protein [Methylobacterium sp. BTF04]NEU14831.1 EAL domain-containing protein [Methylobacterium sp. BTF04]
MAAALFSVRSAFVSQLDDTCQWFLGREGLILPGTQREIAFCDHTIRGEAHAPLIVLDTRRDPRFAANPLVTGAPFLRFYAGMSINLGDGTHAGTVCIADTVPRDGFSAAEVRRLSDLALFVEATLRGRAAQSEARRAHNHGEASDSLLRTTLESMDQGLLMTDAEDRVRIFNRRVATLMGVPEELLYDGAPFAAVRAYQAEAGEFAHLPAALRASLERGAPEARISDYEHVRPNGMVLQVRTLPLPYGGLVRTFTDVTARRAAESALRASEARYRLLAENANDVIVLGDFNRRRLYISPAARIVFGYEPEELVGTSLDEFCHPEDAQALAEHWSRMTTGQESRLVTCLRHRHKDGHYVWIEASLRVLPDAQAGDGVSYVATLRDVSARREAEERVRHMALHDALTGLPNRTLFRDRLDQAIAHGRRASTGFAVLACDLDRFKAVNDSLGHPAGDALLRAVAERMRAVLRPYDTIARLGGDEFAIVLTYLDHPREAAGLAERLIAAVSEPIDLDGQSVEVGVSIGVTVAMERDHDPDELFKRADIALYEAKAAGRNTHREFEPDAGARIATRGQLVLDMKEAIRRDAFHLAYQPVVDAATGVVLSFEALMRWRHSAKGDVVPSAFIPIAEETGMIVPLGAWALQEACREAAHWPGSIRVAVNVSVVQLRRPGIEATVLSALAASGLPANRLKLEVTESVLMQDAEAVIACLHRLRALGVRIALDDFGTGYSSLSYLRRFPFDQIKIDRAFIRDIADPDAAAIVRAVVGIGERLGMSIVAEGVETREQLDLVRREGCTQVQGFLFSQPLTPQEARAYVQTQETKVA